RVVDSETLRTTALIDQSVESLAWSPDGTRLAAAVTGAREVHLWDAGDGRPIGPALAAGGVVRGLFWTPPGRHLMGLSSDGRRKTWDPSTGQVLDDRVIVPGLDEVAFGHDGSFLVTGSDDGRLRAVDAASGKVTAT